MDACCSWSGGKDSALACYRALDEYDISRFVTVLVDGDGPPDPRPYHETLRRQSRAAGVPLVEAGATWETYEAAFDRLLDAVDSDYGVFGTIDVDEHRRWVEERCEPRGITPVFPLWDEDPVDLYRAFLDSGFEAVVVKLDAELLEEQWVGESLDDAFLDHLLDRDVHPMGEDGEYHTITVDGPLFDERIELHIRDATASGKYSVARLVPPDPRTPSADAAATQRCSRRPPD